MRQYIIIIIFFSLPLFSQEKCNALYFLYEYKNKECFYQRKAKKFVKKDIGSGPYYNSYTAKKLLKDAELITVPMLQISLKDNTNYINKCDFLNALKLYDNHLFSTIWIFKDDSFIGECQIDDYGEGGVNLHKYYPSPKYNSLQILNIMKNHGYDYIFYIRGILHAYWLIKDSTVTVYSTLDGNFYKPEVFLNKFYTNKQIRKIINYIE